MSMRNFFNDFEQFFNEFDGFFKFKPISIVGETKTEKGNDEKGEWVKQTFTSKDGSYQVSTFVRTSSKVINVETSSLENELKQCIEKQDFERAAIVRDQIKAIKEGQKQKSILQKKLEEAIKNEEFELAAQLRDQIKNCQ
jgi:excinuclease UvrABC nuclease subunit